MVTDSFISRVNNEGVGEEPFLTARVDTTADKDFTKVDLAAGLVACVVSANGEVGMGSDGDKLFGAVRWVDENLDANDIPVLCSVQARGMGKFKYVSTAPVVNQMVEVDGAGAVKQASSDADIAAGGHLMKGQVWSVDTVNEVCYVWLG